MIILSIYLIGFVAAIIACTIMKKKDFEPYLEFTDDEYSNILIGVCVLLYPISIFVLAVYGLLLLPNWVIEKLSKL